MLRRACRNISSLAIRPRREKIIPNTLESSRQISYLRLQANFSFSKLKSALAQAWKDTYPDEDSHSRSFDAKTASAKLRAQKERETKEKLEELTPEELAEFEKNIPEDKRGVLMTLDEQKPKDPLSVRLKRKIYMFVKESGIADELKKNNIDVKEFEDVGRIS
jgi:hypothetical protein